MEEFIEALKVNLKSWQYEILYVYLFVTQHKFLY